MIGLRRLLLAALALLPGLGAGGCGPGPLTLPQPPQDLTALAAAYASPTGTVDVDRLQQIVTDAQARLYTSDLAWLAPLVTTALVREWRRFEDLGFPTDPLTRRKENRPFLQAVVTAQHTCQGWGTAGTVASATGSGDIDVTAVVDDTQLLRALWGTATACQEQVTALNLVTVNAYLDGSLAIALQGPLPQNEQEARALVQFSGQMGTEQGVAGTSFDFVLDGRTVSFRYPVSDGDVVVSVGPEAVGVRGSNGSFSCDLAGLSCAATTP